MQLIQRAFFTVCAAGLGLIAACGSDDSTSQQANSASAGQGALRVAGAVTRKVPVSKMGDGKGTLHVSIAAECRNDKGTLVKQLGKMTIKDVDLSAENASVPFAFSGLEAGKTYYAAAWFDDVDNRGQDEDLPGTGDLAMFGDLSPRCEAVTVSEDDVDGVKLVLDYEMMFDLPGLDGDSGIMMGEDMGVDPSTIVDDGSRHTVTIRLSRSVEPGMGGDGEGKLYAGLSDSCFNGTTGEVPPPKVPVLRDSVKLDAINQPVELVVEDVPNGVYQFNGFIDDVANGDAQNPRPGIGDLVSFGGFGPSCKQVVVNGKDVTADFVLNLVMPFDL